MHFDEILYIVKIMVLSDLHKEVHHKILMLL